MRCSPRRPLILKRRKLPFQQSDPPASQDASTSREDQRSSSATQNFPDDVRVMQHPLLPDTQVVVIPEMAEVRNVIQALTVKSKESGTQGPTKFILLGWSGGLQSSKTAKDAILPGSAEEQQAPQPAALTVQQLKKEENDSCFDDSLTNIQWLQKSDTWQPGPAVDQPNEKNQTAVSAVEEKSTTETLKTADVRPKDAAPGKPPFSYMTMIQFAINSSKEGLMTLNQIYEWLQNNFDFFRDKNRRSWKNSVRHNLSLHKMFLRKMSPDGKVSYWTIRPEANRGLTLDKVYTPTLPVIKATASAETRVKPLLPRTSSILIPLQLPLNATVCLPSSSPLARPQTLQTASSPRKAKRKRSPKMAPAQDEASRAKLPKMEVKDCHLRSPKTPSQRQEARVSRRKQSLVRRQHEEPLLVCSQNWDSGIVTSFTNLNLDADLHCHETPMKVGRLTSSTPSKLLPSCSGGGQSLLDFSPIRTPGGPARTPLHNYTTVSLEDFYDNSLILEQLQAGDGSIAAANRSLTEGLVLDTMNESLSKILVDLSMDDMQELGLADLSLSDIFPQLK
ncbi:forkhead box protein M1 isoform X2 [Corythoichthys intestinalis]|uniref:forkhead box protein M1 isoform X2 n=1 Tax=Corythoichthys intestinalis TaxID=161448 RepID=UPI0025A526CB|nr:forkhead box protein M1 isoform X2 [Corythoichthys intestinalis]